MIWCALPTRRYNVWPVVAAHVAAASAHGAAAAHSMLFSYAALTPFVPNPLFPLWGVRACSSTPNIAALFSHELERFFLSPDRPAAADLSLSCYRPPARRADPAHASGDGAHVARMGTTCLGSRARGLHRPAWCVLNLSRGTGRMCRVSERGAPTKYLLMLSQGRSSPRGGRPRAVASLTPARFPRSRCGLCNASSRCRRRRQAAGVGEPGQVAGAARQTCTGQEGGQRRGRCCFCAHSPHAAGAEGGSLYPSQPRP